MYQVSKPWIANSRLFLTFFRENPSALKDFCGALLSLSDSQILSCALRSPAFPNVPPHAQSPPEPSLGIALTLCNHQSFHLDILPTRSAPFTPAFTALLPDTAKPLPSTPFLRIFVVHCRPTSVNPYFYVEYTSKSTLCTRRILNLGALPSHLSSPSRLSAFAKLLLVRHTEDLSSLMKAAPKLARTGALLEDYLMEQELSALFCEKNIFSDADSEGIRAMCSLNRALFKENRISELSEASRNPKALARLFREFQEKGLLP